MELAEIRDGLRDELARARHGSEYDRLAAASMAAYFNRYAPEDMRIPEYAPTEITIKIDAPLFTRHEATIMRSFNRALAWVGQSISKRADIKVLGEAQFRKVELRSKVTSDGVVLIPDPGIRVPFHDLMGHVGDLTEMAMDRLVQILPESETEPEVLTIRDLRELPPVERKAVREIASAAKPAEGLKVSLAGDSTVSAAMSVDQAKEIRRVLKELSTPEPVPVKKTGRLEGARMKRQRFWLEGDDGHEYEGTVDASLMLQVKELLDQDVKVVMMAATPEDGAGKKRDTAYLLTEVQPKPPDLTLLGD